MMAKLHFLFAYLLIFPPEIHSVATKGENGDFFDCNTAYHQEGDINIGLVSDMDCTYERSKQKYSKIIPMTCAIDGINQDTSILPNLKLGFTILNQRINNCKQDLGQRVLQFLPDSGALAANTSCPGYDRGLPWYDVSAVMIQVTVAYSYVFLIYLNTPL